MYAKSSTDALRAQLQYKRALQTGPGIVQRCINLLQAYFLQALDQEAPIRRHDILQLSVCTLVL